MLKKILSYDFLKTILVLKKSRNKFISENGGPERGGGE